MGILKKYVGLLPLLIFTYQLCNCIYVVSTSNVALSYEHYIGFGCIAMAWMSLFLGLRLFRFVVLLMLFLSAFAVAGYTPVLVVYKFGASVNRIGFNIQFQDYCLILTVVFVVLSWSYLKTEVQNLLHFIKVRRVRNSTLASDQTD